jgi:N-sulfoglucosamine sulfohydrolase
MRFSLAIGTPLLLLFSLGCAGEADPGGVRSLRYNEPTNVLLFVAPDVGTTLGCYGVPGVQTPRLDMLSRSGVRFEHMYAASPVQSASRASLLTGRMPAHLRASGTEAVAKEVPTWGELFGQAGYRTGLIGDLGIETEKEFPFDYRSGTRGTDAAIRTAKWHIEALDDFLGESDDRPWALVVCLQDSRWPFPTDGAPFGHVDVPPHAPADVSIPHKLIDTPAVREELKRYYDGLRRMDAMVGAVVDRIAAKGLRRHTVGLFTSDNGSPFPFAKASLYEAGVRVPLIAWGKRVEEGAVRQELFAHVDVIPTLLGIASAAKGAPVIPESMTASLDGETFDYFLGEQRILNEERRGAPTWRTHVAATLDGHGVEPAIPSQTVRFGKWKYIRTSGAGLRFESRAMQRSATWRALASAAELGDTVATARVKAHVERAEEELYDLATDPGESINLATDSNYAEPLAEGRKLLESSPWLSKTDK